MKFLTINEAVASCSSVIKNPSREDRLIIKFWIWLAEKQIGCHNANIAVDELDVYDLSVLKPDNHLNTIDLSLVTNDGSDIKYVYRGANKRIHETSTSNNPSLVDVYEDRFNIFLGSNATSVDKIILKYWSYPVDEDGNPLIPEEHMYAIMRFVSYMYAEKESLPESKISRLSVEWKLQASKARAKNKMPDIPEARSIMKSWISLLPDMSKLESNIY
jgi:hypothetical protein